MDADPTTLRHRAARLRALAARLDQLLVHRAHLHAGGDTWRGPVAAHCLDELHRVRHRLGDTADDLRREAARLDAMATWEAGRR